MDLGMCLALGGVGIAIGLSGAGSSIGVGLASQASAGVLTADPSKFGRLLVMMILPGTQGLYGLIVGIMVLMNIGVLGGSAPDVSQGAAYLAGCIPMAIGGLVSAIHQGKVCAAGVNIIAKRPEESSKAIVAASLVELYALLAFIASFLIVINI
ncbi:MAG TPA: V-type ATP synthase subunit K [Clostridiales bacterium]|nr:V-type ATP synthase subunit K [Clostridiales bacterium]